jgi:uncharacterized protein YndB with AHSA1/START domain
MLKRQKFSLARVLSHVAWAALTSLVLPAWSRISDEPSQSASSRLMTMQHDLARRSPDIRWPQGFAPTTADLFAHSELMIDASCERVWKHIVEVTKWPQWYPNSKDVHIVGDTGSVLKDGTTFRWTTFDLAVESKVQEFVPFSRIGWYGYAPGTRPTFYHAWYLTPRGNGCQVVTDEVGKGPDALRLRKTDAGLMHRGHDLWLATLKWVSEGK